MMRISTISRPRMQFTAEHCWIDLNGSVGFVGVSAFRLQGTETVLGIRWVNRKGVIQQGELVAQLDTTHGVIPVHAPVCCKFLGTNNQLAGNLNLVLQSPHDKGWLFFASPLKSPGQQALLSPDDYRKLTQVKKPARHE